MSNYLVLACCCIFCSCMSLKKKSSIASLTDSVTVWKSLMQQQTESMLSADQMIQEDWEGLQVLEISAAAPYRLHPDSGLMAGAGYLRMKISGKGRAGWRTTGSTHSRATTATQQHQEEKVKIKQETGSRNVKKYGMRSAVFAGLLVILLCLCLIYRYRRW